MSILENFDYFMSVRYCEYKLIKKNDNERQYQRKYFELDEVYCNLNGNTLNLSVPSGEVQYRTKFEIKDQNKIFNFLQNRLNI